MEILDRFLTPPEESFFLFGPRGTGKSTLVKFLFPRAFYIDLLDPETFRSYSARPERLRELLGGTPAVRDVIIDEIQKLPQLLDLVHSLIERQAGWRFVLTGSSARKLRRGGVDLLAGRALLCRLHPFMAAELGERFDLAKALQTGLLPVVMGSRSPEKVRQAYAALYLREEVQMEGMVRSIGDFTRFLEAAAFSHASLLNISNVARECRVERKTVEGYMEILEDLLLGHRLSVFTRRAQRALVSHPKFYLFDAGIFRSLRPRGPLDRPEEIDGQALEGLVFQHLRSWVDYSDDGSTLSFWRTRAGSEVDFVLYGPGGIMALEVKNSGRVYKKDLRPLKSFMDDYQGCKAFLLYRGKERLLKDDILCLPVEEFLAALRPGIPVGEALNF